MRLGSVVRRAAFPLAVLVVLAGCSSGGGTLWSGVAKVAPATPVVFSGQVGRVALAPVASDLPERRSIGTVSRNAGCWVFVRQLTEADFPAAATLGHPLRAGFEAAHVPVAPGEALDIGQAAGADYFITARVAGAQIDMCNNAILEDAPEDVDASVNIAWQIWSTQQHRVVLETSTSGIGHSHQAGMSVEAAVDRAMGDAVTHLLQTASLQAYLTFGHPSLPQPLAEMPQPVTPAPVGAAPAAAAAYPSPVGPSPVAPVAANGAIEAAANPTPLLIPVAWPGEGGGAAARARSMVAVGGQVAGIVIGRDGTVLTLASACAGPGSVAVTLPGGATAAAQTVRTGGGFCLLHLPGAAVAIPIEPRRPPDRATVRLLGPGGTGVPPVTARLERVGSGPATLSLKGSERGAATGGIGGFAVLDTAGNLVGIAMPAPPAANSPGINQATGVGQETSMVSIAGAFRALNLGAELDDR